MKYDTFTYASLILTQKRRTGPITAEPRKTRGRKKKKGEKRGAVETGLSGDSAKVVAAASVPLAQPPAQRLAQPPAPSDHSALAKSR